MWNSVFDLTFVTFFDLCIVGLVSSFTRAAMVFSVLVCFLATWCEAFHPMHVVCVLVASFEIVCSSPRVFVACLFCCVGFWYCGHVGSSDFRVRQSFAVGTQEVTDLLLAAVAGEGGGQQATNAAFRPRWREQLWGQRGEREIVL